MIFLKNKLLEGNSLDLEKICYQSLDFANSVAFDYNHTHNLKEEKLAGSTLTLTVLELSREGKKRFFGDQSTTRLCSYLKPQKQY